MEPKQLHTVTKSCIKHGCTWSCGASAFIISFLGSSNIFRLRYFDKEIKGYSVISIPQLWRKIVYNYKLSNYSNDCWQMCWCWLMQSNAFLTIIRTHRKMMQRTAFIHLWERGHFTFCYVWETYWDLMYYLQS